MDSTALGAGSADPTAMVGLMPPPPGVTPDFYHTTSVQVAFIAVFVVTFTLATVALMLRLYTRAFLVKSLGPDEPLLLGAWTVTLVFFTESVKAMPAGFGRNMYEVTPTQLVGYFEKLLTLALTYIWPGTLTKLSILVLYWRINPDRIFRSLIALTAAALVGYTITFHVLFSRPCNPLLGTPESQVCLNNIAVSQAVLNIVSDAVIIVLPVPTLHRLHLPLKQRISIGMILGLGSAATIASIIRIAYVRAMVSNPDFTFTQCSAAVWSLLEMNLGILCNSLATLKPFLRRHLPGLLSRTGGSSGYPPNQPSNKQRSGWKEGSYRLSSMGKGEGSEETGNGGPKGKGGLVIERKFELGYESGGKGSATTCTGRGDSTDSILALEGPAQGKQVV